MADSQSRSTQVRVYGFESALIQIHTEIAQNPVKLYNLYVVIKFIYFSDISKRNFI